MAIRPTIGRAAENVFLMKLGGYQLAERVLARQSDHRLRGFRRRAGRASRAAPVRTFPLRVAQRANKRDHGPVCSEGK
jgi:hypothetical protein